MICTLGQRRPIHITHQLRDINCAIHCVVQRQSASKSDSIGVWFLVKGKSNAIALIVNANPGVLSQPV